MVSASQFKHDIKHHGLKTKLKSPGRIMFVHAALEAYETAKKQRMPAIQQLSYLYEVDKQCRKWLATKNNKTTATSLKRQLHVTSLMQDVSAEIAQRFPDYWKALSAFGARKAAFTGNGAITGPKGVYAHEKTVYQDNKAAGRYLPGAQRMTGSATLMHGAPDALGARGHQNHAAYARSGLQNFFDGGGSFKQLSEAQFRELARLCAGQSNMLYLSKIQRLDHMIMLDGGLMKWPNGTPITLVPGYTVQEEMNGAMYAVDKYGNFFVIVLKQGIQLNHTTLCAGGEVMCAGTLSIKNGRLRGISNDSGHYMPSTENLRQVVQLLVDAGVSMDNVIVVDASVRDRFDQKLMTSAKLFLEGNARFGLPPAMGDRLLAATN